MSTSSCICLPGFVQKISSEQLNLLYLSLMWWCIVLGRCHAQELGCYLQGQGHYKGLYNHRLRTMQHHISFGYKRMNCSEDIFWTKQADRYTRRRIHGHGDSSIPPPTPLPSTSIFTWGITKTWKRFKTKLYMFRKCCGEEKKAWKVLRKSSEY